MNAKPSPLTHFDAQGDAHMVDVGAKASTHRVARATGRIGMQAETLALIRSGHAKKGDVLGIARLAGIMGAKKTSDLIPLCHPIALSGVTVDVERAGASVLRVVAEARTTGPTGVEMEAMTAAAVAALTLYDMAKALDKAMTLQGIRLISKTGGKSGDYRADDSPIAP